MMVTKWLPVNAYGENLVSIGQRLREERERLGFSQPAFAAIAETTKKSQIDYEKDLTQPRAGYFEVLSKVGLDVLYVITGTRSAATLTSHEQELLGLYQAAQPAVRAAAVAALASGVLPQQRGPIATFGGKNTGQVAETIIGVGMVKMDKKKP